MKDIPQVESKEDSAFAVKDYIAQLVSSGAITQFQADFIASSKDFSRDSFTHPYLRNIREHTRAYLERAAQ